MNGASGYFERPARSELVMFSDAPLGPRMQLIELAANGGAPAGDVLGRVPNRDDAWVVFAPADTLAPRRFRTLVEAQLLERPDVQVYYGDDAALGETSAAQRLRLKPSFDITQLAAQDYVGAPLIVRASALHRLGGLRATLGDACLYDLLLRSHVEGFGIERIPQLLLAWPGRRPITSLTQRRRALQDWIGARPFEIAGGLTPESIQLSRRFTNYPPVTVVIPTRQAGDGGSPFVVQLLDSLAATDWPLDRLEVIVGDDSERQDVLAPERWPFTVRRIPTPRPADEPFNYSAKMNRLWRLAASEHLVLMNDDVKVRSPGWLKALMTFAMERDVGGVGARLLFPDGRLQHAGVVAGLFGVAAHPWFGAPADAPTYQDWALVHREWSIVTAAVFATRRSVLEELAGFDERLALDHNDVDLCLRMRLLAYRIIYTPFAELMHREKASRGATPSPAEDVALFFNRWRELLGDDPAYHPALSQDEWCPEPAESADVGRS